MGAASNWTEKCKPFGSWVTATCLPSAPIDSVKRRAQLSAFQGRHAPVHNPELTADANESLGSISESLQALEAAPCNLLALGAIPQRAVEFPHYYLSGAVRKVSQPRVSLQQRASRADISA